MSEGWIKLHRKLFHHWLWDNKPKTKFEAWVWMINSANHRDNKFMLGNELIDIKRGQFITSELKLMDIFKWSKSKLRRFLKMLEKDSMVVIKRDRKKTTITLTNYCIHQDKETTKEPQKNHRETTKEPQKDTNKKEKKEKKEKKIIYNPLEDKKAFIENIPQGTKNKYPDCDFGAVTDCLVDYCESSGKIYKDYHAALRTFINKDIENGKYKKKNNINKRYEETLRIMDDTSD